jgi:hypothetical protein
MRMAVSMPETTAVLARPAGVDAGAHVLDQHRILRFERLDL